MYNFRNTRLHALALHIYRPLFGIKDAQRCGALLMLPKSVIEPSLGSCVLHGAGSGPNDVDDGGTSGGS